MSQPKMPLDSGLDDHHDCSQNWVMVARPVGCEMGMHPCVKVFDDSSSSSA